MPNEVFRFMVSRPPQSGTKAHRTATTIKAYSVSRLVETLRSLSDKDEARKLLVAFLNEFQNIPDPGDPLVATVMEVSDLFTKAPRPFGADALERILSVASRHRLDLSESIRSFVGLRDLLGDRLLAQTLLNRSTEAYETTRLLRAIELILTAVRSTSRSRIEGELIIAPPAIQGAGPSRHEVERILRLRPILPDLRIPALHHAAPDRNPDPEPPKGKDEQKPTSDEVSQAIKDMRTAAKRIEREYDLIGAATLDQSVQRGFFARLFNLGEPEPAKEPSPSQNWLEQIPDGSRKLLQSVLGDVAKMSLSEALHETKRHLQRLNTPAMATSEQIAKQRAMSGRAGGTPKATLRSSRSATVPQGIGVLGSPRRGDLVIVRQELARYQLGEIAHIENVLQGETHERSFARNQTAESVLSTSRETTMSEERDTQSTERFELSSAAKKAVSDHLKLEAGVSISASYGPTVGVQANSQFGYDHAQEESKEAASSFAREMTSSAKSKVETRVTEQRVNRMVSETRELTRHAIDNAQGNGHVRGLYRWVNKVYQLQVVNYGIRDLYEVYVPEPAAFIRHLHGLRQADPLEISEPVAPVVVDSDTQKLRPLRPDDLKEENYGEFVAQSGARDVTAPPAPSITVSAATQISSEGGKPTSLVNSELIIPEGYVSTALKYTQYESTTGSFSIHLRISGRRPSVNEEISFPGRVGKVPFGVVCRGIDAAIVTMWVACDCTDEFFRAWQLNTYAAIMEGYQLQKAAYDEQLAAANAEIEAKIAGRAPAANLEIIRNELKRAAITIITAQRFELFNSMLPPGGDDSYPEIMLDDAEAEGRYVAFIEQAFEWENMTYVLYPYFWGKKADWPVTSQLDDVDDQFARFLRAGFARIQLPVRPGSEALVAFTFDPNNWSGDVWTQSDPPGFERDGTMTIEDELRAQTGGLDHVQGPGRISIAEGNTLVIGTETDFSDDDLDRELRVDAIVYRVTEVIDETQLRILAPGPGKAVSDQLYSLGPKLVGPAWELTLPTTLVYLQQDAELNPTV